MKATTLLMLVASAGVSHAQITRTEQVCAYDPFTATRTCVSETFDKKPAPPRPPISKEEQEEIAERDAAWIAYCRPIIVQGEFGVRRYRYIHPECEFGRYESPNRSQR
jgi:hypothetical protein